MPEYLAPGVYVEEVSFRAKSIEGVSTSVAGFIGPTRYGPTDGPPELLTSFADFSRIYGGLDNLDYEDDDTSINYMAHAVRAFFDNGGSKLYVTRVFSPSDVDAPEDDFASLTLSQSTTLRARFPGAAGSQRIVFALRSSPNVMVQDGDGVRLAGVREQDLVYVKAGTTSLPGSVAEGLYDVLREDEALVLSLSAASVPVTHALSDLASAPYRVHRLNITVRARRAGRFEDEQLWTDLAPDPDHRNAITRLFAQSPSARLQYLTVPFWIDTTTTSGGALAAELLGDDVLTALSDSLDGEGEPPPPQALERVRVLADSPNDSDAHSGTDGRRPNALAYKGSEARPGGGSILPATGLETFVGVDNISIVAAPGHSADYGSDHNAAANVDQIVQHLIIHCEQRMRYRVAVLDAPNNQVLSEVQAFRGKFDSTHAALYYPWVTVLDPLDPDGRRQIQLPPSGFVAGIYARTDVRHGVFKAPANEVVLGAIGFEQMLNKAQQDVLNPMGVNCFRFFEGRGFRLWGARTISSDPEWKYISVRRYFAYLEHSIDKGTQWAVFENNGDRLWANVTQTITDFLFNEWRNGALLGLKPEEAFFVRCDRSTMTQNDLDNGRLVCLIGVAPVKPAEFVIFRIGQFTADRKS